MQLLQLLIQEAKGLTTPPALCSHYYKMEGGRSCPKGYCDCSQAVYVCELCGTTDYGYKGSKSYNECYIGCSRPIRSPEDD